jgi:hypothetical protein
MVACGRSEPGASGTARSPKPPAATDTTATACSHAACGQGYFVDAVPQDGCSPGAACRVSLKLVATGDFHVNDEYPYRFKGEPAAGVEFLGTDPGGKNVFSKPAGDWAKADAKSGVMTLKLTAAAPPQVVTGVFKLSVCSAESCLIDQPQVRAVVALR